MFKKLKALFETRHEPRTVPRVDLPATSFQVPQDVPAVAREKIELPEKRSERLTHEEKDITKAESDSTPTLFTPAPETPISPETDEPEQVQEASTEENSSENEQAPETGDKPSSPFSQVTSDEPAVDEEIAPKTEPDSIESPAVVSAAVPMPEGPSEPPPPAQSQALPVSVSAPATPPAPASASAPTQVPVPKVPTMPVIQSLTPGPGTTPAPAPASAQNLNQTKSRTFSPSAIKRKASLPPSKNTARIGPTPEQLCNISPSMTPDQIRQRLAFLYKRYNRASSSLNAGLRAEAEAALDAIVAVREKYFGPV